MPLDQPAGTHEDQDPTPSFCNPHASILYQRLVKRTARIAVVGLGYAGLPLAVELGLAGFQVLGIDNAQMKCDLLNRGRSSIADVSGETVAELVASGSLLAKTAFVATDQLDVVIICVPTPLGKTRDPDLSYVIAATQSVKAQLRPGMLIILESTTYPGTTEELVASMLNETGLLAGIDYFLAFSPERVDPGNKTWTTRNVPKVVGGATPDCTALAAALYRTSIEKVVPVSSPRVAEMVKLLENTFRAVNIGLANEMALMCDRMDIDIWEVIAAAGTKPFGFMTFYPGPGLGGHCIPVDPAYLSWKGRQVGFESRLIEVARDVNGAMPHHVVEKVSDALGASGKALLGASVLLIGVAYKRDISDVRESPALDVMALLLRKGARVSYYDPYVPQLAARRWNGNRTIDSIRYSTDAVAAADCVAIMTDHSAVDYEELAAVAQLVVDTRNAVRSAGPHIFKIGAPNPRR